MARDTHRDVAACFAWKQVGLGFSSLPQNWRRSDDEWSTWHLRGGRVKIKLKTDGSMRWAASDSSTSILSFFVVLDPSSILVFWLSL
jgi:hypothetical protein